MKKVLSYLLLLSFALSSAISFAKEPLNIAVLKQQIIRYHDTGEYEKDIANVTRQAMRYLQMRLDNPAPNAKKPAIVLDIDETAISNYPNMVKLNFGGTMEEIHQLEEQGKDSAITPTLKLYQFAKAHHVAVFFITGRMEDERDITVSNLQAVGYSDWDGLTLRNNEYKSKPAAVYKTAMRKDLAKQGYDIMLNLGDQKSDLAGGYADKTFKLPNPFYLIP